jgi:uncharacterized protein YehS (DUF1456 family)
MTNNDVLRSLRYALELEPAALEGYFAASGVKLPLRQVAAFLKQDEEPGFEPLCDEDLARCLDGMVAVHRGRREGAPPPPLRVDNNHVLRSLRIALELKDVDVLAIMDAAGVSVSKAELSALFRREDHRNYQPCGDQFLRNFLRGLAAWHRAGRPRG